MLLLCWLAETPPSLQAYMLAVFQHFPSWDWDFLPSEYRDSPHFNLDFEILDSLQTATPSCETVTESLNQQVPLNKIPKAKLQNKSLSSSSVEEHSNKKDWLKCRELVKTIQSSLMNLCGLDLRNLVQQLQQVAYEMKNIYRAQGCWFAHPKTTKTTT